MNETEIMETSTKMVICLKHLKAGIQTSYSVHICPLAMTLLVAMETLLSWQQRHVFITSPFEGI